jgi:hypothetical protein
MIIEFLIYAVMGTVCMLIGFRAGVRAGVKQGYASGYRAAAADALETMRAGRAQ